MLQLPVLLVPRAGTRLAPGLAALGGLFRHAPFAGPLLVCLPVLALAAAGPAASPRLLTLLLPFGLGLAAGYIYNDLMDRRDPPGKGNPVADGRLGPEAATLVLALTVVAAFVAAAWLFRQPGSGLAFAVWLGLLFAYSGLGIRLKETLPGPGFGAFVLWIGPSLVLALELGALGPPLAALLGGAWLTFTACELAHMLVDFEGDRAAGYRTCAQRLGRPRTFRLERLLLALGLAGWLGAAVQLLPPATAELGAWVLSGATGLVLAASLAAGESSGPSSRMRPYGALKRAWAAFAVLMLSLPPTETVLLLWLCCTIKLG